MTDIRYAHKVLESVCDGQVGIAIGTEIFEFLVNKAINLYNSYNHIEYPSGTNFQGLPISFKGKVASGGLSTKLTMMPAANPRDAMPVIEINNVAIEIETFLDGTLMSENTLTCATLSGGISQINGTLQLHLNSDISSWTASSDHWSGMVTLPDGQQFTQAMKDDWAVNERAVLWVAKNTLATVVFEAVDIPNVIDMITAVQFTGPIQISGADDLIVFSGPSEWKFGCSSLEAPKHLAVAVKENFVEVDGKRTTEISFLPDKHAPDLHYQANEHEEPEQTQSADVFVHLPRKIVEKRFDNVVKPGAGFADSGRVGPIRWHYESALLPQGVTVTMTSLWPLEFRVDLPATALGSAGAGIKVGCVYWEAAGFAFDGEVSPLEVYFKLGLDSANGELYFQSRLGNVVAHDFQFHHWPDIKFPLNQIADFVLARVAEFLMSSKSGELLSATRFSFVEYKLVSQFGRMLNTMASEESANKEAVSVGVTFKK